MITLSKLGRTVRETTAPFEYNDPATGELKTEDIRVRYFSQTIAELKKMREDIITKAKLAEADPADAEIPWLSGQLSNRLESLPDILDAKGKPIEISIVNLDQITALNLRSISEAIEADAVPRPTPGK